VGRVVRQLREGFAVKFIDAQAADKLEDRLVRPLKQFAAPGRRQS